MANEQHSLWVERYRPNNLDEYVWRDAAQRTQVEQWITEGVLPNLILSGRPGVGKTSMAKMVLKMLDVNPGDILEINASRERKVEDIQNKLLNFVTTWPLGRYKYILFDEADSMTPLSQRMLRGDLETYSDSCRFIFTCNYPQKIIPALHSRCQGFDFQALDMTEFTSRIADILITEKIALETEQDIEVLDEFVDAAYPDLRKCINLLQQHCRDGKLHPLEKSDTGGKDYLLDMASLFKDGKFTDARKLIVSQAQPEEYDSIYRFMYQNLAIWGDTEAKQNEAILIIRKALVNHSMVGDVEINLAAALVELSNLSR